ncbi:MAG: hypothetical protein GY832_33605 [Chloroflexi bacterium]|nr:hypothetical protein [Chloroflexota bacterium]
MFQGILTHWRERPRQGRQANVESLPLVGTAAISVRSLVVFPCSAPGNALACFLGPSGGMRRGGVDGEGERAYPDWDG